MKFLLWSPKEFMKITLRRLSRKTWTDLFNLTLALKTKAKKLMRNSKSTKLKESLNMILPSTAVIMAAKNRSSVSMKMTKKRSVKA